MNRIYHNVCNTSSGATATTGECAASDSSLRTAAPMRRSIRLTGTALSVMLAMALSPRSAHADVCSGSFADANRPLAADSAFACGSLALAWGNYSAAIGNRSTALGDYATALGYLSLARGEHSIAIGHDAISTASGAIAIGQDSAASGDGSIALGAGSVADQAGVVSIGNTGNERRIVHVADGIAATDAVNKSQLDAVSTSARSAIHYFAANGQGSDDAMASGLYSTAAGAGSFALGVGASAFGSGANAIGHYSLAAGYGSAALGDSSTAVGQNAQAQALASTALGYNAVANGMYSFAANGGSVMDGADYGMSIGAFSRVDPGAGNAVALGTLAFVGEDAFNAMAFGTFSEVATGAQNAIAIGTTAYAGKTSATAIGGAGGFFDQTTGLLSAGAAAAWGQGATALGSYAQAYGDESVAVGVGSIAAGNRSVAVGAGAGRNGLGDGSVAVGELSQATGNNAVALGAFSQADRDNSVSIGSADAPRQLTHVAAGTQSTDAINKAQLDALADGLSEAHHYFAANGLGYDDAVASGLYGTAAGSGSFAMGDGAAAFGGGANAIGQFSLATGYDSVATGDSSTAVGVRAMSAGDSSIAIGNRSKAASTNGIAIGSEAKTSGTASIAVGYAAQVAEDQATAVGALSAAGASGSAYGVASSAMGVGSLAMGWGAATDWYADYSVALGFMARTQGVGAVGIGVGAWADGDSSVAIGEYAWAKRGNGVAVGNNAVATADGAIAIGGSEDGRLTRAEGLNAVAIGLRAAVDSTTRNSIALGANALVDAGANNAVALGADSYTDRSDTVSVGRAGAERQITHVAAGTQASDAVNKAQLDAVADSGKNTNPYFKANGRRDGSDSANAAGVESVASGANAHAAADGAVAFGASSMAFGVQSASLGFGASAYGNASMALGAYSMSVGYNSVALGNGSVANRDNTLSVGHVGSERQITNVAAGTADTDAVNVYQLKQAGLFAMDGNSALVAPAFNIQGNSYASVNAAFGALDGAMTHALDNISALNGRVDDLQAQASSAATNKTTATMSAPQIEQAATANMTTSDSPVGNTLIGSTAQIDASSSNATAVGADSTVTAASGTALGQGSHVTASHAVALGAGSVADQTDTVSVGSAGAERRVANVATGINATDAANVGQVTAATQSAIDAAEAYADNGDAQTLSAANTYTDQKTAGLVSSDNFNAFRDQVNSQFHEVNLRLNRVGAMGSAMAGMAGAIAAAPGTDNRVSAAAGTYAGQSALAVGFAHRLPGNGAVLIGGSVAGGGESSGSVGVSFGW